MSASFQIVPWFNSKEWCDVYQKIYSNESIECKQNALDLLMVWKARCPSLPSGIESTLTLLEVHINDLKNIVNDDYLLRLAYSTAIMRFVNHMLDAEIAKGTSLYQAAKSKGVPDWIVDLRHDTAHSNVLPSINILREASSVSLEWLQNNYWEKHKPLIEDYKSGHRELNEEDESKISVLMNFCVALSICAHSKCKIKNLKEIPDPSMRESIESDAKDLFEHHLDFSNSKTVSLSSLINLMNLQAKQLLKSKNTTAYVNKALTCDDSLFLSLDLLNFLSDHDFKNKSKLSFQYVQCFEVLLTFLHSQDLLLEFILDLIRITQGDSMDGQRQKLAALWVSEIFKSLKKSKLFCEKKEKCGIDDIKNKTKKELKLLFHHWFPNERNSNLLLDLNTLIPKELEDIKFIQPIISIYNPFLIYFIKDLLDLIKPSVPKTNVEKICRLASLISTPNLNCVKTSTKIYTVDDLQCNGDLNNPVATPNVEYDSDCMEICEEEGRCDISDVTQSGIWQKASRNFNWSTCPFGILPWQ